ncbi:MAG: zf-HC2 domain-containing protein [Candidatus Acidiferrales bacterium]
MSMNSENRNAKGNCAACTQYEAMLEDQLQGVLRGPEAAILAEHLVTCAGCRATLEDAAVSMRLLAIAEPAPDPGAGFSRMVMARIRQELQTSEGKSIWRPVVSVAWRVAASAAFALVLLVSFDLGRHSQLVSDQSVIAENRMPEIVPERPSLPVDRDDVLLMMADTSHGKQ